MRAVGGFLAELACVFIAGVFGFFLMLVLAAGLVLAWLIGCMSGLFLVIALAESGWWMYTHSVHAGMTALGYYCYAAATFALIPVLAFLKEVLTGWPARHRGTIDVRRISGLSLTRDAPFAPAAAAQPGDARTNSPGSAHASMANHVG